MTILLTATHAVLSVRFDICTLLVERGIEAKELVDGGKRYAGVVVRSIAGRRRVPAYPLPGLTNSCSILAWRAIPTKTNDVENCIATRNRQTMPKGVLMRYHSKN
jgi:hypothetical protein